MQTGEHWYEMQDPQGAPQGYARIQVADLEDGAQRYLWELHLAFPGGTYEEERSTVFDAEGRMLETTYEDEGSALHARREGSRLLGTHRHPEGESELDLEVEDEAVGGMGFVLVTTLPLDSGFSRTYADYNEAQGCKPEGEVRLVVGESEVLELPEGKVTAVRVVLHRADGRELPMWVDGKARLLQADWGGGNLMILHPESTEALFRPAPPTVEILDVHDLTSLVVGGTYAGVTPEELFRWWTEPDRLLSWWPQEAEVGDGEDGAYVLSWPEAGWKLLGRIRTWEPGRRLAFTWAWEHTPDRPELVVDVTFEPADDGTRIHLVHGPYRDTDEDRKEREGHWQGWKSVCARLEAALKA